MTKKLQEVEIREWINKGGGIMVNAYALSPDDPDYVYNQILAQGQRPEDFGINHPYTEQFKEKTREELMSEIVELRKEIVALHRASAAGWI